MAWAVALPGMDPVVDSRDLVTALVICARLGLARTQRVHQLVDRKSDPMPAHVWAQPRVHLWYWPDVRAWAARQDGLVVLEPGRAATGTQIADRLDLDPEALPDPRPDGTWDWEIAEQAWIDAMMNVHRD